MSLPASRLEPAIPVQPPRDAEVILLAKAKPSPALAAAGRFGRGFAAQVIPPVLVLVLLVGLWQLMDDGKGVGLPTPFAIWRDSRDLILDPFFDRGGTDKGLFWHVLTSLSRVGFGFSLAAVVGKAHIMDAPAPGGLGGTYGGNPVACAAALGSIATMEELDLNAVARHVETQGTDNLADIAASFREAVADVLTRKAVDACLEYNVPRLLLGGGVAANARIRALAAERCAANGIELRVPPLSLCTDNGAMIAMAAAMRVQAGQQTPQYDYSFDVKPRWPLSHILTASH